jgi:hypothetical protein
MADRSRDAPTDLPIAAPYATTTSSPRPRVAIATCAGLPDLYYEGRLVIDALLSRGVEAAPVVWNSGCNWDAFGAVMLRTTEDYFRSPSQFLDWTRQLGTRLLNSPGVVEWNIDKHYLLELADRGISVVSTQYVAPGDYPRFPAGKFVVKPAMSAGANSTAVYDEASGDAARRHIGALHKAGRTVMLQPYYHRVDTDAETAAIFIDGQLSHCMRKEPLLRLGQPPAESRQEDMSIREPEPDMVDLARRTHAVVAAIFGVPLYARADMLRDDSGQPVIIELELVEPMLFLDFVPGSADRLATAFIQRAGLRPTTTATPYPVRGR